MARAQCDGSKTIRGNDSSRRLSQVLLIYGLEGHAGQVADAAEEAGVDIVDFIVLFGSPSHQVARPVSPVSWACLKICRLGAVNVF